MSMPSRGEAHNPTFVYGFRFAVAGLCFIILLQTAFGQGLVSFSNRIPGATSHVYLADLCFFGNGTNDSPAGVVDWGTLPKPGLNGITEAATTFAQLLSAPGANRLESELMPAAGITTFRTGAAAGNVAQTTATLANVPKDAPVATMQMVVWENRSGLYPTWTQASVAWATGLIKAGRSSVFNLLNIGGGTNPPPFLTNLVSFSTRWPEPSGQPWIFIPPQNQTVQAGTNVTFFVATSLCTLFGPYEYQWQFQGTNLVGATNQLLTLNNAQFYHAGSYQVVVRTPTNWIYPVPSWAGQSNTSSPATLTVTPHPNRPQLKTGGGFGGFDSSGFHFTLSGPADMVYRLETSTNLVQWNESFWVTNTTGTSLVTIPIAATSERQFFRATQ
jgi:hypothetical protein